MKKYQFLLIASLFLLACQSEEAKKQAGYALPVDTITVQKSDIPISLTYPGKVTSDKDVIIRAQASGVILDKYFKAGDFVTKGQKLFLINPEKYQAAVNLATASLQAAQANQSKSQLDLTRVKKLKSNNAVSAKDYDQAYSQSLIDAASVSSAQANLKAAQIDLSYTTVTAPFAGYLSASLKDVGSFVSPSDSELIRLTEIDPIYVDFAISDVDKISMEQNIANKDWEQINSKAKVQVSGQEFDGEVVFIEHSINQNSGSVNAKVKLSNKDRKLLPGAFATVTMEGLVQKNGVSLPLGVIFQDVESYYVLVIDKEGKAARRNIKISKQDATKATISQGLEAGDKVIADNFMKIRAGSPVIDIKGAKK